MVSPPTFIALVAAFGAPWLVSTEDLANYAPVCPKASESWDRFHADTVCDRAAHNRFKDNLNRHAGYRRIQSQRVAALVPEQKTVVCPLGLQNMEEENQVAGMDTLWVVENAASNAIVLSYMKNGVEVSAVNPSIAPPQADPQAILQPGQFRSVYTYEGHHFVARELKLGNIVGDVLLQHRVGLLPVGTDADLASCSLDDPDPVANSTFTRTWTEEPRFCNMVDVGFRNKAGCPLHAYWVSREGEDMTCKESFRFHLGVNPVSNDYAFGWDSTYKFERSFVGHTFAFRLAADPSVLVDTVTVAPTRVVDCPGQRAQATVAVSGEAVALPIGHRTWQHANASTHNLSSARLWRDWNSLNATVQMASSFHGMASY